MTTKSIEPYGWIIDSSFIEDDGHGDKFDVLVRSQSSGWRIGYLILRSRILTKLEKHPNTLETFEPVKGKAVIALAPEGDPKNIKVFLLDKPIVLKKGVWHNTAAVSKKCEMKIFEDAEVQTEYYDLKTAIKVK